MASGRLPFKRLHLNPVAFRAAPFAVPVIDMAFQFTHRISTSFARHFTPPGFLASIADPTVKKPTCPRKSSTSMLIVNFFYTGADKSAAIYSQPTLPPSAPGNKQVKLL